jgi:hypothetical protein
MVTVFGWRAGGVTTAGELVLVTGGVRPEGVLTLVLGGITTAGALVFVTGWGVFAAGVFTGAWLQAAPSKLKAVRALAAVRERLYIGWVGYGLVFVV